MAHPQPPHQAETSTKVLPAPEQADEPAGRGREGRLDLNVPQVAGSAVAAVVAAKLASNLGVYGTIVGAGVVSVLGTCGGSILQHLFRRTGRHMQEVAVQARPGTRRVRALSQTTALSKTTGLAQTTALSQTNALQSRPVRTVPLQATEPTAAQPPAGTFPLAGEVPGAGRDADGATHTGQAVPADHPDHPAQPAHAVPNGPNGQDGYSAPTSYRAARRGNWKRPVVAVALAFGLTMAGITGYEAVAGENISGHGHGTTIGNAVTGHSSSHSGGSGTTPAPGTTDSPSSGGTSSPFRSDPSGRPGPDTTPSASQPTGSPSPGTGGNGHETGGSSSGGSHATPTPTTPPPTPSPSVSPTTTPSGEATNGTDTGTTP